jgi:RNA polymerase sigma factor (sigma-70 family)
MVTSSAVAFEGAEQDDAEVIRQVLQGNTAMFELLMRRYNERVYRAARGIVRDEHEAEDVMQQAYVNAFTHLRQFNGSAQFSTWLTRIAVNESLARVRRQGRYKAFDQELPNLEAFMSSHPSENPVLEQLRGGGPDGWPRQLQRSTNRIVHRADAGSRHAEAGSAARLPIDLAQPEASEP